MADVVARLILPSPPDSSSPHAETRRTQEDVGSYRADEDLVHDASRRLVRLGFRVQQADTTGISFIADRDRFEIVFDTRLESRDRTMLGQGLRGAKRSYFVATEPIKVPGDLKDVGAAVVLPHPPELVP